MPAVPLSCGSSAAKAWGRASRAASRLASAWRMTGSLCTASSNTPTRSLGCAAPENASNTSARVEARFMAFPSCKVRCWSKSESRRPHRMHQRVDHRLEQALCAPGVLGRAPHQACFHHRRLAHHHEQTPAGPQQALEARIVEWERGGYRNGVVARAAVGAERIRIQYLDIPHAERREIAARRLRKLRKDLQRAHLCRHGAQARRDES